MKRLDFPNGWYCECRPDGSYAVLIRDSHVATSFGDVPLPPGGNLLQLRLGPNWRMAGTGHQDGNAWEWDGTQWQNRGPAFGNNACFYDAAGLHIVVGPGTVTGSIGVRYIDDSGAIIPAWWTYDPSTDFARTKGVPAELWEWTERGGIIIGQGAPGVVAYANGTKYQIADGQTTFVRYNREGDNIALAWVREDTNSAHLLWLTVAELLAFPKVAPPPVIIDHGGEVLPTPVQPPLPLEPKLDAKPLPDDIYAIVVELHARNLPLAAGSDDDRRVLQQKICETVRARKGARWGWKSNHGINQSNAKDAIAELPEGAEFKPNERQPLYIWDLFNGTTRAPNKPPVMSETENVEQYFVPVAPIDHLADASAPPQQPPQTPPPVATTDPAKVDAILAGLTVIADTLQKVVARLDAPSPDSADIKEIRAQLARGFTNKYAGPITPRT